MQRGVIYARYSCDKQTDNSIRGQVRECTLFAEREGIQIIDVYQDEAISGRTDRRPAFLRMFRDAARHMFDVVIVWKGDRFSRNRADAAKYKNELKKLNIRLLSATEANLTGAEAVLMDGVNEAFAEFYSVELAEKVNRGMMQNVLEGRFTGGVMVLGYKVDENHKIVIDEEGAQLVRFIFEQYTKTDISIHGLFTKLNNMGYKNAVGKPFKYDSLERLLNNRKYIGEFMYKGEINYTSYPPIIDNLTFEKAQEKMKQNKKNGAGYRSKEKYYLTGKLFCGECGEAMRAYAGVSSNAKKGLYRYYKCGANTKRGCGQLKYRKEALESAVFHTLVSFISKDINVEEVVQGVVETLKKVNPEITRLETALAETETAIKNYKYALEKGLNLDDTIERLKELDASKKAYVSSLVLLKKRENIVTPDVIRSFLKQTQHRNYNQIENCVFLLNYLVYKILVYKNNKIKILLNIGGDDDPMQLESMVRELVGSDHQFVNILKCLNTPEEFRCLWMEIPITRKLEGKKKE